MANWVLIIIVCPIIYATEGSFHVIQTGLNNNIEDVLIFVTSQSHTVLS